MALAAELSSGFIARSHGALMRPHEAYLLLEYCPGGDVEHLIDREGSLNPAAARFYAGCLALALEALHGLGIVHRDVKPDNLCIGADGYARLVDLAYAKVLPPADGRLTTLLGTPEYLAPEAFQGRGQQRPSDMWAFGVSLYVMLIAAYPWDAGESPQDLYTNVLEKPPFFPERIISRHARGLIERCLQKEDAAARPTAAEVFDSDFFRHPQPPSAPRDGLVATDLLQRRVEPPFVPHLASPFDTRHFLAAESDEEEARRPRYEPAEAAAWAASIREESNVVFEQPGGELSVARRQRFRVAQASSSGDLRLAAGAEDLSRYV